MSRRTRLLLLLIPSLSGAAFAQGETGFLRGAGRVDAVFSWTRDSYDEFWAGKQKVGPADVGEITREALTLYVAYGLTDDIDLFASGSQVSAESDGVQAGLGNPDFADRDDLQDAVGGVKWRAWSQRAGASEFSFLFAPSVKVPLSDYEANAVTVIGDGQVDLRGRAILHWRHDSGAFASIESGYDRRNGEPSDEVPLNVTLGATFFDMLTITPFYSQVFSLGGYDIGGGPFPGTREEYERVGVGAYLRITEHVGLTGLWRTTLDGRNTGDADSLGAGIVLRL